MSPANEGLRYYFEDIKEMIDLRDNPELTCNLIKNTMDKRTIEYASKSRYWEFRLAAVENRNASTKILAERAEDRNPIIVSKVAEHLKTPKYAVNHIIQAGPKVAWKYISQRPDLNKQQFKELLGRCNLDIQRALATSPFLWEEAYLALSKTKDEDTIINLLKNKYVSLKIKLRFLGESAIRDFIIGYMCDEEGEAEGLLNASREAKIGLTHTREAWTQKICKRMFEDADYEVRFNARRACGEKLYGEKGCGALKAKDMDREVFG